MPGRVSRRQIRQAPPSTVRLAARSSDRFWKIMRAGRRRLKCEIAPLEFALIVPKRPPFEVAHFERRWAGGRAGGRR